MKKLCMFYFRYAGCFLRGRKFRAARKFRASSGESSGLTREFAHMCSIGGPEVPGLPRSSGLRFSVRNGQIWWGTI